MLTNVDFLCQMVFLGKINYRLRKSALDFLLVIHWYLVNSQTNQLVDESTRGHHAYSVGVRNFDQSAKWLSAIWFVS